MSNNLLPFRVHAVKLETGMKHGKYWRHKQKRKNHMKEWDRNTSQIQNTDEKRHAEIMLNMVNFLALKLGAEIHRNPCERSTFDEFQQEQPMWGRGHLQFLQSYRTYCHSAMWVNHLR